VTLELERDATVVVDIEVYDQGEAANALGTFAGETPAEVTPEIKPDGLLRFDRNAAFLTRGRFYVRAVAAEETELIRSALEHVAKRFADAVPGEELPWSYALFVGALGANPGKVKFVPANAFSFEFAKGVHTADLEGDLQIFVMPQPDAASAKKAAAQFVEGWLSYGDKDGAWVKDRYLNQFAGAKASGRAVIGLRGAPDIATAEGMMSRLERGLAKAPASAEGSSAGDEQEEGEAAAPPVDEY
jgi:hypothetical protein